MTPKISVGGDRILVPSETYRLYLDGVGCAALIERDGQIYLLPLRGPVAGGALLKQRNLRGDRVMLARDFLAERGLAQSSKEREFAVRWVPEAGALLIEGLRASQG